MAVYEYLCRPCDKPFSVTLPVQEYGRSDVACPDCLSHDAKRLFSAPSIVFKGDGFYSTDSRSSN